MLCFLHVLFKISVLLTKKSVPETFLMKIFTCGTNLKNFAFKVVFKTSFLRNQSSLPSRHLNVTRVYFGLFEAIIITDSLYNLISANQKSCTCKMLLTSNSCTAERTLCFLHVLYQISVLLNKKSVPEIFLMTIFISGTNLKHCVLKVVFKISFLQNQSSLPSRHLNVTRVYFGLFETIIITGSLDELIFAKQKSCTAQALMVTVVICRLFLPISTVVLLVESYQRSFTGCFILTANHEK